MQTMRTLITVLALAALAAAVAGLRLGPAEAQAEVTVYVSGLNVGRNRLAVVRLHNLSPNAADQFDVRIVVRNPANGVPINPSSTPTQLFAGRTIDVNISSIVAAVSPKYEGPIEVLCVGSGGFFVGFGPESVAVEGNQKAGKATFNVVTRERE